ncbi:hypothetical protein VTL71DRAFT_7212 [Oculimacula yallundae]|uniref:Uncharacterized protein n=1 Tax=Oculimacula yallundae TaxID=86028 RepID=A0ABR4BXQ4_9HELO
MLSYTPSEYVSAESRRREENIWATLPPFSTIKPEQLKTPEATQEDIANVKSQSSDQLPNRGLIPIHRSKILPAANINTITRDPNNPHHPARWMKDAVLIKSIWQRNHYYWMPLRNPLPKETSDPNNPKISFTVMTSESEATGATQFENQRPGNPVQNKANLSSDSAMTYNPPGSSQNRGSFPATHPKNDTSSTLFSSTVPSSSFNPPESRNKRTMNSAEQEGRSLKKYSGAFPRAN